MKEMNFTKLSEKVVLKDFVFEDVYVYINLKSVFNTTGTKCINVSVPMKKNHMFMGKIFNDENLYQFIELLIASVNINEIEQVELPVKTMKCVYTGSGARKKTQSYNNYNSDDQIVEDVDDPRFVNFTINSIVIDKEKLAKGIRFVAPFEQEEMNDNAELLSMYSSYQNNTPAYEINIREDVTQSNDTTFTL